MNPYVVKKAEKISSNLNLDYLVDSIVDDFTRECIVTRTANTYTMFEGIDGDLTFSIVEPSISVLCTLKNDHFAFNCNDRTSVCPWQISSINCKMLSSEFTCDEEDRYAIMYSILIASLAKIGVDINEMLENTAKAFIVLLMAK